MSGTRIVFDGLWRCLCPSVDALTLSRAIDTTQVGARSLSRRVYRTTPSYSCQQLRRQSGKAVSQNEFFQEWEGQTTEQKQAGKRTVAAANAQSLPHDSIPAFTRDIAHQHSGGLHPELAQQTQDTGYVNWNRELGQAIKQHPAASYINRVAKRNQHIPSFFFDSLSSWDSAVEDTPTSIIYEALRELCILENRYHDVARLVEYLIVARQEKPNSLLYEILISANVDKEHGSAKIVSNLLKEMSELSIQVTPGVYVAVLHVLAIHPDYNLRNEVLRSMKQRWITPTPEALQSIAIGLLRDQQFELALDYLEKLNELTVPKQSWIYQIFIYTLTEARFHQEALDIAQYCTKSINKWRMPNAIWSFLLEAFSKNRFYDGVSFIWKAKVEPSIVQPTDGILVDILNTASANGDTQLATEVIRLLSLRKIKLDLHHYEPLLESYTAQGKLTDSFAILCIMKQAGIKATPGSTRPIYRLLKESPMNLEHCPAILRQMKLEHEVPVAAFNVVLEATLHQHGFKAAFSYYQLIREICPQGPDVNTLNLLLRGCVEVKSLLFLLNEMKDFNIRPDEATYDCIVYVQSKYGDLDLAFQELDKMSKVSKQWWVSKDTALALVEGCLMQKDARIDLVVRECAERGLELEPDVQTLAMQVRKQKEKAVAELEDKQDSADMMTESLYA